jgi:hypothetical protein
VVVQSVVFHAIDYARRLGFEPDRDFPAELFGPRPAVLTVTPWHAADRPIFVSGPHDDTSRVIARLTTAVGPDGFDRINVFEELAVEGDDDDDEAWDDEERLDDEENGPPGQIAADKG